MEGIPSTPEDDLPEVYERNCYAAVGNILGSLLNRGDVRYIGHHFSADSPWMEHWLGLNTYQRCVMDTEFAQQCVDESSELSLERGIAMKYTTLGFYNQELLEWKRENRKLCAEGYGYIPSEILHPYACLRQESLVQLADGRWRKIKDLVESRYRGEVKAMLDGRVQNCRVTGWHKADANQKAWYRLLLPTSVYDVNDKLVGPVLTPDHKVLTQRGKVRVDELIAREDRIITDEPKLTDDQLSIVLGSVMGMTGCGDLAIRKSGRSRGMRLVMNKESWLSRCHEDPPANPYADWKMRVLGSALSFDYGFFRARMWSSRFVRSNSSRQMADVARSFPNVGGPERRPEITKQLLDAMGWLGLAVWYQDCGEVLRILEDSQRSIIVDDDYADLFLIPQECCTFKCPGLSSSELQALVEWLSDNLDHPLDSVIAHQSDSSFSLSREASEKFLWRVFGYIHPFNRMELVPSPFNRVNRKLLSVCGDPEWVELPFKPLDTYPTELFSELLLGVMPASNKPVPGDGYRYCLSVERAENFLTKDGFVSNCKDVLAVFRAYPCIKRQLEGQRLWKYYNSIILPFVSDVFHCFAVTGLPMDRKRMDEMRELFHFARRWLEQRLKRRIHQEAKSSIMNACMAEVADGKGLPVALEILKAADPSEALEAVKPHVPLDTIGKWVKRIQHLFDAPAFNIRSPDMMRRWLFDVEGLTPIKSTNQKAKGMPSMSWEKVQELPPERQRLYTPAVDKQTMQILSEQFNTLDELLNLNAVGNICKAFLKEAEVIEEWVDDDDEDGGDGSKDRATRIKEQGLHAWLASDCRIHGQCSLKWVD